MIRVCSGRAQRHREAKSHKRRPIAADQPRGHDYGEPHCSDKGGGEKRRKGGRLQEVSERQGREDGKEGAAGGGGRLEAGGGQKAARRAGR